MIVVMIVRIIYIHLIRSIFPLIPLRACQRVARLHIHSRNAKLGREAKARGTVPYISGLAGTCATTFSLGDL